MEKAESEHRSYGEVQNAVPFEDALNIVGSGKYNIALLICSGWTLLAMAVELFGFSFAVTSATCDLKLTLQQQGILTSLPFMAIMFSSFLWGYLSDTRGRRRVLLASMYASFILSSISSLSPNWVVLAVVKFISVCFSCAANAAAYTLLGECCPAAVRAHYMLLASIPLMFAQGVPGLLSLPVLELEFSYNMPWLGIDFRPWRLLVLAMAAPCGLGALSVHLFFESPKFLASRGRDAEAIDVLRKIYFINKGSGAEPFEVSAIDLGEATVKAEAGQSLLRSLWEQAAPLFRPPLLRTTLRLYFLLSVIYTTNNSFEVWFPRLFTSLFMEMKKGSGSSLTLCNLLSSSIATAANESLHIDQNLALGICSDKLDRNMIWAVVVHAVVISIFSLLVAQLHTRKKAVLISCVAFPCISAVCVTLMPEPISAVLFFFVVTFTALSSGICLTYFVELYPTAYRGMVACLGVMVGRLATFFGINIVGNVMFTHCQAAFYGWALLLLGGVLAACYLPSDQHKKPPQKNVQTIRTEGDI